MASYLQTDIGRDVDLERGFSSYPKADADARIAAAFSATGGLAVPVPDRIPAVWGLKPGTAELDWVARRLTPHPLASYTTCLELKNPIGNDCPRTYLYCKAPSHPLLEESRKLLRSLPGWKWLDIDAPHEVHITNPDLVADILLGNL